MSRSAHFIHVNTCDLEGIVFSVPVERENQGSEAPRSMFKVMEPLKVRPGLVYTSSESQTYDFSTRYRISFAIKSSAFSFFSIVVTQQGTALSWSLPGSNIPLYHGTTEGPTSCLKVHESFQNYSTFFLFPQTDPYLTPTLPYLASSRGIN